MYTKVYSRTAKIIICSKITQSVVVKEFFFTYVQLQNISREKKSMTIANACKPGEDHQPALITFKKSFGPRDKVSIVRAFHSFTVFPRKESLLTFVLA